jgi:hypothetical protein
VSHHKDAAFGYAVDATFFCATTVWGWLASVHWAPLVTLVLIPSSRYAGALLRYYFARPAILRENAELRGRLMDTEQRLAMREEDIVRLRTDRLVGPRESNGGHDQGHPDRGRRRPPDD